MCSIKTVYQKKVHKYTFLGLKLCFMLTINGLWGCEVGVLCRGSTPEVHSAGKHICEVVFLGRQWFHVSNGNSKRFREHG